MERMPSDENCILSSREASATGWVDEDPTIIRLEKEARLLAKPEFIRESVDSIFSKYAEEVTIDGKKVKYTPDIEISILGFHPQDYGIPSGVQKLFISHLPKENIYAIIRKQKRDDHESHLPVMVISGTKTKTKIRARYNQIIDDENSLVYTRRLIDKLKQAYEWRVRQIADSVDVTNITTIEGENLGKADCLNFYLSDTADPDNYFRLDSMMTPPSRALEISILGLYRDCPDIQPTQDNTQRLELTAVTAMCKETEVQLQKELFQPLFKELSSFDVDDHHLRPFRLRKLYRESSN